MQGFTKRQDTVALAAEQGRIGCLETTPNIDSSVCIPMTFDPGNPQTYTPFSIDTVKAAAVAPACVLVVVGSPGDSPIIAAISMSSLRRPIKYHVEDDPAGRVRDDSFGLSVENRDTQQRNNQGKKKLSLGSFHHLNLNTKPDDFCQDKTYLPVRPALFTDDRGIFRKYSCSQRVYAAGMYLQRRVEEIARCLGLR